MNDIRDQRIDQIRRDGTAQNTVLAYNKDLKYFWAWAAIAKGIQEDYPIDTRIIEDFVLDHVEGLKPEIDAAMITGGFKATAGKHAVTTVYRRLKALAWFHKINDMPNPLQDQTIRSIISSAKRVESKAGRVPRRSNAITKPILDKMIKKINIRSLAGKLARAVLEFGFYTGGRRRSEIAGAQYRFLTSIPGGGYTYLLHRCKTDQAGKGELKILRAAHAKSLKLWIDAAGIRNGYLFRRIKNCKVTDDPIDPSKVNKIIKRYAEIIGEDPTQFSAHGLRRGFITHCGRLGIPLFDVMKLTGHKKVDTVMVYYEQGQISNNPATKL